MKFLVSILCLILITVIVPRGLSNNSTALKSTVNEDMVFIKGGSFNMGDIFGDGEEDEYPEHTVMLDSYWLGKCEVTVGEFRTFVNSIRYKSTAELEGGAKIFDGTKMTHDSSVSWQNVNFYQDDSHPVVCLSWLDAISYCNWRSRQEGLEACYRIKGSEVSWNSQANSYHLPTEAEWEYAARSRGKDYKYSWGNGDPLIIGEKAANIRDETAKREWGEHVKTWWHNYDDGFLYTAPVASFAPNELGLYDISGNVYEWCRDWYNEDYYQNSPEINPCNNVPDGMHACRDVGYGCLPISMRTVNRGKGKPDLRFLHGSFRLCRSG